MSWPEALELLSAELGEPVTFRVAAERQFLEIGAAVTDEEPDWAEVSNVRAVIVDGAEVVLARSRNGVWHLAGGRLEAGELPEAALARELREELGVGDHVAQRIGRIRLRHLTAGPGDYPYPFPVF